LFFTRQYKYVRVLINLNSISRSVKDREKHR
jgi:hypothetical protein